MSKRGRIGVLVGAAALVVVAVVLWRLAEFPPDTTPEGAYLRIAAAVSKGDAVGCFAYLEEEAQHAAFTIHDYAARSAKRIETAYPPEEKKRILGRYHWLAAAEDGPDVWARLAERRGWIGRLRRDLSGVVSVEVSGDRATVVTARGTRYSFRRRPNGIWGLTLFTAELESEAQRLARDWEQIDQAAADYEREAK
jgi:hypothetical protein